MKKLILSLCLFLSLGVNAQTSGLNTMVGSGDTLDNTETLYVTFAPSIYHPQVSFNAVVSKISGTIDGYGLLQMSNDNVNFIDVNTDTLQLQNVITNDTIWTISGNITRYYRIKYVGVGTMSAKVYGYILTTGGTSKHFVSNMLSNIGKTSDTTTNTATSYLQFEVKEYHTNISIQFVITKISGTVGGTVTIQGSLTGSNYEKIQTAYITTAAYTPTNITTNTKIPVVTGNPYKFYRVSYTGTGTMSAKMFAYLVAN